ncbi:MAG TPA: DUF2335 domain-containing protein [Verrucomicrobiae bacterium]|nr:DUF2335 domain-containing protein [Verrucomicrobiae bacterium]
MSENVPPEPAPVPLAEKLPEAPSNREQRKTLEEFIQEKAPDILEAIPVGKRPRLAKVTIEETRISYRSGMLPEPAELEVFNTLIPNGADRIMKMTEAQSAHRMDMERTVVTSQQGQEQRGQWFGLIIALFFASCGTYSALHGQAWFGGIITGTTLVSLVGLFVYSKQQARKDLSDKREAMMNPMLPRGPEPVANPKGQKNRRKK